MSETTLPADPLAALGSSIFLTVLSYAPVETLAAVPSVCQSWLWHSRQHHSSIWRAACYRAGIDSAKIQRLAEWNDQPPAQEGGPDWHPDYIRSGHPTSEATDQHEVKVNWKEVCRRYLVEDRNWRFGRCKERWIYPEKMAAWRFKIDDEEDTCMISSVKLAGGIEVVDVSTSEPLFSLPDARSHAHLEFCKGFLVFDSEDSGLQLEVYRTRRAIARSGLEDRFGQLSPPAGAHDASSSAGMESGRAVDPAQMARGALVHYRTIRSPTDCYAFRARPDGEGTERERAMLGSAGDEAAYIWDLADEARPVEVIPLEQGDYTRDICYIEFDDHHVFICRTRQLHIYSRQTKSLVLAYPPLPSAETELCAVLYHPGPSAATHVYPIPRFHRLSRANDNVEAVQDRPGAPDSKIASVDRETVRGLLPDDPKWGDTLREGMAVERGGVDELGWPPRAYQFSACHYGGEDLVCSTIIGQLIITRNYQAVLGISDPAERQRQWWQQTIVIALGRPIRQLAVDGSHIIAAADIDFVFLETSTLPTLPILTNTSSTMPAAEAPTIKLHSIRSTHPSGVSVATCSQIHRSSMFHVYGTGADLLAVNPENTGVPLRAATGRRRCIRGWDFCGR